MFRYRSRRSHFAGWRRPADVDHVRVFAVLVLVSGVVQVLRPVDPAGPDDRLASLIATSVIGGAYWLLARRFRIWTLHTVMLCGIVLGFRSILTSASPVDATIVSTSLLWTGVLAAATFRPVTSRLYATLLAAGCGASLLATGMPEAPQLLAVLGLTIMATMELVNRLSTRMRTMAMTDPLTQLTNRAGMMEAGATLVRESRTSGRPLAVAVIDLDGFKAVNDEQGHAAGDLLLMDCARIWRAELRRDDVLARLGGDEFVLITPGIDRHGAQRLLQRMADRSPVGWSHGLTTAMEGDSFTDVLNRADLSLVSAKAASRGRDTVRSR